MHDFLIRAEIDRHVMKPLFAVRTRGDHGRSGHFALYNPTQAGGERVGKSFLVRHDGTFNQDDLPATARLSRPRYGSPKCESCGLLAVAIQIGRESDGWDSRFVCGKCSESAEADDPVGFWTIAQYGKMLKTQRRNGG